MSSNQSTVNNVSGCNFLDYIPVVSTIKSLVHLVQRCCNQVTEESSTTPLAGRSLAQNSLSRTIVLLIPFIGNIIVAISDFTAKQPTQIDMPRNENPTPNGNSRIPSGITITTTPTTQALISNKDDAINALKKATDKNEVFSTLIHPSLKANRSFMECLFDEFPACFTDCNHDFSNDSEMALIAIKKDPEQFKTCSDKLKLNIQFIKDAAKLDGCFENIQSYFYAYFQGVQQKEVAENENNQNNPSFSREQVEFYSEIVLLCPSTTNVLPEQLRTEELKNKFIERHQNYSDILNLSIDLVFKNRRH